MKSLRRAVNAVPSNFISERIRFITGVFNALSRQDISDEMCESYLALLEKVRSNPVTTPDDDEQKLMEVSVSTSISHFLFLSPPVGCCINGECVKKGVPDSLYIHHHPVNVTVFTMSGPILACKVSLRCKACNTMYNYCKYGNKMKSGERMYDQPRDLVEVSDVVYCERMVADFFISLK